MALVIDHDWEGYCILTMSESSNYETTIRFLAKPREAGIGSNVQPGVIMRWMDQGGYTCASEWLNSPCILSRVSNVKFESAVNYNSLVETKSNIIHTNEEQIFTLIRVFVKNTSTNQYLMIAYAVFIYSSVLNKKIPSFEAGFSLKEEIILLTELISREDSVIKGLLD